MVNRLFLALLLSLVIVIIPTTVNAEGIEDELLPLCLPDLYFDSTQDCIPFGPTAYLLEMAELGITFPETPLPVRN